MKQGADYRHVRPLERVTATSAGVALDMSCVVHFVTTNGDQDLDDLTMADGSVDGERHYISVVALGNASDTLKVTPVSPGADNFITWTTTQVGTCVELMWDATLAVWQIVGGNEAPVWSS